ncbi:MAG: hypothetical protein HRU04_08055 [Oceanospirillaceae bacterium]|nr:hypothetical protein [Oceanospirillaceae bacterium]
MKQYSTKVAALLVTTICMFSYSKAVFASESFGESLLNAVIKEVTKEIVGDTDNKDPLPPTKPAAAPVVQAKLPPPAPVYHRPRKAKQLWEQYKDWNAYVETFMSGGGDWVTNCSIHTGGDGSDSISTGLTWGEPLSSVTYSEATARGYATRLQREQKVTWAVRRGSKIRKYQGETDTGHDNTGIPYATNTVYTNYNDDDDKVLRLFRDFAKGREVVLVDDSTGADLYIASLSGFSAAYRKMSVWCGFSSDPVLR